ncbi:MAG: hypothetical protein ACRDGJ_04590 [Candidatus Limnocylindria bacterium]
MARSVTRWVASIKGGPDGLLASGWDSDQLVPVMWRSADGSAWERLNASTDALGGSVGLEPAWGSAGWVVQHDCRQRFVAESITAADGP